MKFPVEHIVFDFEVMKHDWGVVFFNKLTNETTVITNDREKLLDYYLLHQNALFIGFNVKGYDLWIMKSILLNQNPMDISDFIINKRRKDLWNLSGHERIYQRFPINIFDAKSPSVNMVNFALSLKEAEANMGESIIECEISWDIDRKLTPLELKSVMTYCENDVKMTDKIFNQEVVQQDLIVKQQLIKLATKYTTEPFPLESGYRWSNPRLIAKLLNAHTALPISYYVGEPLLIPQSIEPTIHPEVWAMVNDVWNEKYWYRKHQKWCEELHPDERCCMVVKTLKKIPFEFKDMIVTVGAGGVHGALLKYVKPSHRKLVMSDAKSMYPNIMMIYELLPRAIRSPEIYKKIYDLRFEAKAKGDSIEQAYKLILNMVYGDSNNKFSKLYDPHHALAIPMLGQLLLLNLAYRTGELHDIKLVQLNTDGIICEYSQEDEPTIKAIMKDWENDTGLELTHDPIKRLIQKDVNNYIMLFENGKLKLKGSDVKQYNNTSFIKNHMSIIAHGVVDHLLHGISVRDIVNNAPIYQFSFIAKHSMKYDGIAMRALDGSSNILQQRNRVFAIDKTKYDNSKIGILYKLKLVNGELRENLIPNSPECSGVFNGELDDETLALLDTIIDREWYINKIYKALLRW